MKKIFFTLFLVACASKGTVTELKPGSTAPEAESAATDAEVKKALGLREEGLMYLYSKDPLVKNLERAFDRFSKAAELGDPLSMDLLGSFYSNGIGGVQKSCAKALEWYEKSASAGLPIAWNNLAYTLVTCPDKKLRDPSKAEAIVQSAFQQGEGIIALLDTYAAVLAATGDFRQAAKTMDVVVDLSKLVNDNQERIDQFRKVLASYRQGKNLEAPLEGDPMFFHNR